MTISNEDLACAMESLAFDVENGFVVLGRGLFATGQGPCCAIGHVADRLQRQAVDVLERVRGMVLANDSFDDDERQIEMPKILRERAKKLRGEE